jgi:hypothetical protein
MHQGRVLSLTALFDEFLGRDGLERYTLAQLPDALTGNLRACEWSFRGYLGAFYEEAFHVRFERHAAILRLRETLSLSSEGRFAWPDRSGRHVAVRIMALR